jgi:hypothetical protein
MQPKSPKLLEDIRDAASFIREVTSAGRFKTIPGIGCFGKR